MKKLLTIVAGCILFVALPGCFNRCKKPCPAPKCPPAPCQKQDCPTKKIMVEQPMYETKKVSKAGAQSIKKTTRKPATTAKKTMKQPAKPTNGNGAIKSAKPVNGNGMPKKPATHPKTMNGMTKDMPMMMPEIPVAEPAK